MNFTGLTPIVSKDLKVFSFRRENQVKLIKVHHFILFSEDSCEGC